MLCLGVFSVTAQVTFLRELLVIFYGNELSIAVMLCAWLLTIGAGAFAARLLAGFLTASRVARTLLPAA